MWCQVPRLRFQASSCDLVGNLQGTCGLVACPTLCGSQDRLDEWRMTSKPICLLSAECRITMPDPRTELCSSRSTLHSSIIPQFPEVCPGDTTQAFVARYQATVTCFAPSNTYPAIHYMNPVLPQDGCIVSFEGTKTYLSMVQARKPFHFVGSRHLLCYLCQPSLPEFMWPWICQDLRIAKNLSDWKTGGSAKCPDCGTRQAFGCVQNPQEVHSGFLAVGLPSAGTEFETRPFCSCRSGKAWSHASEHLWLRHVPAKSSGPLPQPSSPAKRGLHLLPGDGTLFGRSHQSLAQCKRVSEGVSPSPVSRLLGHGGARS